MKLYSIFLLSVLLMEICPYNVTKVYAVTACSASPVLFFSYEENIGLSVDTCVRCPQYNTEHKYSKSFVRTSGRSREAVNLLNYLKKIDGKKILSATMAHVAWNTNEAEWVYLKTGRYPAINCVDYIHLYASQPGSWIDYSQIQFLEDWWSQKGIVSAMWHWVVPANDGKTYTYTPGDQPDQTSFDIKKINDPSSAEYARMMADIDKIADYLLLLKEKNIPVIWRPLHEAGGGWFWWGKDAESCKRLWRVMHDRFEEKGLNNLIWVWTLAVAWQQDLSEGIKWYPGDKYVDIIGIDMYNVTDALQCRAAYSFMKKTWPNKLLTLSECGNVPLMETQWKAGAHWLWFMPWYDYPRTIDPHSIAFEENGHSHADATWWEKTMSYKRIITRDELPVLR